MLSRRGSRSYSRSCSFFLDIFLALISRYIYIYPSLVLVLVLMSFLAVALVLSLALVLALAPCCAYWCFFAGYYWAVGRKKLRLVNFNVYMGYDRLGEDNTFRVGKLLKELEADVAVLQVCCCPPI